jgi:hypothetical protein
LEEEMSWDASSKGEALERIEAPSPEEFREKYLKRGRPVVIRGIVDKWKAVSAWKDMQYLAEKAGERSATVSMGDYFARNAMAAHKSQTMRLAEYIRLMQEGRTADGKLYLSDVPLSQFPELVPDVGQVPYGENTQRELDTFSRVLFFGRDTYTPPHHHANNMSVLCQIAGKKRMIFFPPDQSRYLYPYSLWSWLREGKNPMASQVDLDKPDLKQFPLFKHARPLECEAEPGDMVFIPVHWWHAVYSPGISLAVTYNFHTDLRLWHFPSPGGFSLLVYAYQWLLDLFEQAGSASSAGGKT